MIRILIILLGTYGIINIDIDSNSLFYSRIIPVYNVFYLMFLIKEFTRFLYSLSASGTKGNEVNIGDLLFDVFSLIHRDISQRYAGKLRFLGGPDSLARDLIVQVEIVCVIISIYNEFKFIAQVLAQ